jgi:multicomponent Na+:H+ antiporter subunit C
MSIFFTISLGILGANFCKIPLKQLVFLNLVQIGVILFFLSLGFIAGSQIPILPHEPQAEAVYNNPIPAVLMLTAIVVGFSVTVLGYALIIKGRDES